jgi:curved DNA-binding protein CbpA
LLVKVWHEDRFGNGSDTALLQIVRAEYQQVMGAWNLLRNPRERADYDRRNKLILKGDAGQDLGPKGTPDAWYRLSHFLKEEDLGKSIHRSMAYKQGDALERDRELSEKQQPYADEAWAIGEEYGFDPSEG